MLGYSSIYEVLNAREAMGAAIKSIGLFGILLFGVLFSFTFLSPEYVEKSAKGFVKYQIEKEVIEKQKALADSSVASQALSIAESLGLESEKLQEDLDSKLPDKIASIIASMCGYDCERKKALSQSIASGYMDRLKSITVAQATLGDLIKGKYIEIVSKLKFDLRIFLGTNFVMFLILLAVSFAKPKAIAHLFLPGILLVK